MLHRLKHVKQRRQTAAVTWRGRHLGLQQPSARAPGICQRWADGDGTGSPQGVLFVALGSSSGLPSLESLPVQTVWAA